jgi:hypothetical protein
VGRSADIMLVQKDERFIKGHRIEGERRHCGLEVARIERASK